MNLSQSTPSEWPASAVPESWITALFEKLANQYGARFLDLWRGVDMVGVRREWGMALAKLSPEQLRAGVHSLHDLKAVPTLAEFVAHCRQARREDAGTNAQLTDQRRADAATQREGMARLREAVKPLMSARINPGSQWAHDLLARGTGRSGQPLTPEVIRVAKDAIRNHSRSTRGGDNDE